jgi:hypothetical protein
MVAVRVQQALRSCGTNSATANLTLPAARNGRPRRSFGLEALLKFSCGASFRGLSDITGLGATRLLGRDRPFYPNAFSEQAFQNNSARSIVYGHTHHYEVVPLKALGREAQIYVNSGTWRAVHDQAMYRPHEEQFVGYHVMTYLAFFKPDERAGRKFETWSGALGKS